MSNSFPSEREPHQPTPLPTEGSGRNDLRGLARVSVILDGTDAVAHSELVPPSLVLSGWSRGHIG
jgi:hypothetical protein